MNHQIQHFEINSNRLLSYNFLVENTNSRNTAEFDRLFSFYILPHIILQLYILRPLFIYKAIPDGAFNNFLFQ